jgi:ribose transport system ATP-binding protein
MLQAKNISKSFPGVKALQGVNLTFHAGKVNAILGENGAGKSTLLKILTGVYTDFEGEIFLDGKTQKFKGITDAQNAGIGIIHQELNLIPHLNITENVFLGNEIINKWGLLDTPQMEQKTSELLQKLKLSLAPKTLVQNLKVGEQQLVEIARVLLANRQVILMDEPTSALSDAEIENLHNIIEDLKSEGKTIVYISHKMDELFKIAQFYTVLRDGQTVDAGEIHNATEKELINKMVGRDVQIVRKTQATQGQPIILKVKDLTLPHPTLKNRYLLKKVSLELKKGEIVGIFGLMGAGRTEILQSIFGLNTDKYSGEIHINDNKVKIKSPKDAIAKGLAFVTEDRKSEGLVLNMDIASNISLTTLKTNDLLSSEKDSILAKKYIDELSIKTPNANQHCINLSGGNQQKVVLAKWLATNPEILMLDEPTRGIDIKAKSEIYEFIHNLATSGKSILIVSSEIPEILALSDRIYVLSGGEIKAEFNADDADENLLLKAAI